MRLSVLVFKWPSIWLVADILSKCLISQINGKRTLPFLAVFFQRQPQTRASCLRWSWLFVRRERQHGWWIEPGQVWQGHQEVWHSHEWRSNARRLLDGRLGKYGWLPSFPSRCISHYKVELLILQVWYLLNSFLPESYISGSPLCQSQTPT